MRRDLFLMKVMIDIIRVNNFWKLPNLFLISTENVVSQKVQCCPNFF